MASAAARNNKGVCGMDGDGDGCKKDSRGPRGGRMCKRRAHRNEEGPSRAAVSSSSSSSEETTTTVMNPILIETATKVTTIATPPPRHEARSAALEIHNFGVGVEAGVDTAIPARSPQASQEGKSELAPADAAVVGFAVGSFFSDKESASPSRPAAVAGMLDRPAYSPPTKTEGAAFSATTCSTNVSACGGSSPERGDEAIVLNMTAGAALLAHGTNGGPEQLGASQNDTLCKYKATKQVTEQEMSDKCIAIAAQRKDSCCTIDPPKLDAASSREPRAGGNDISFGGVNPSPMRGDGAVDGSSPRPLKRSGASASQKQRPDYSPKKAKSSWIFFYSDACRNVKLELGHGADASVMSKRIGEMWKALSKDEKKEWEDRAAQDRVRYRDEKTQFDGPKRPQEGLISTHSSSSVRPPGKSSETPTRPVTAPWSGSDAVSAPCGGPMHNSGSAGLLQAARDWNESLDARTTHPVITSSHLSALQSPLDIMASTCASQLAEEQRQ